MESNNRNTVIVIVVVIAVIALLCCLALIAVAAGTGLFFPIWRTEGGPAAGTGAERTEQSFAVGSTPELQLDNFAGSIVVRAGEGEQIRVTATKRVTPARDLDRVEVSFDHQGSSLEIRTRKPATLVAANVQFELVVPPGTRAELRTGSGTVEVEGIQGGLLVDTGSGSIEAWSLLGTVDVHTGSGSITVQDVSGDLILDSGSGGLAVRGLDGSLDAHTGSGSIDVNGASGPVRLDTGSGSVAYQGTPRGDCRFETGSGRIVLRFPADLDARVDLETGSGTVDVAFPVEGQVDRREVEGVIGSGEEATIFAHTGTGNIEILTY
jgi:hypothetical protein